MPASDYRCKSCDKIFEFFKSSVTESFPSSPQCPHCGEADSQRIYTGMLFDVAEGTVGNAKNGYSKGVVNHPSSLIGKVKGKKIK